MASFPAQSEHDDLTTSEIERYSRQLLLPQFGPTSQKSLKASSLLIVGLGGLGCPAALYLAGAGVGTLGLVDRPDDVVEKSNLHRQIAHTEHTVGINKLQSAEAAIRAINSTVTITKHHSIVPENAIQLVAGYDLVLDCTDNVASRYLISDACASARVPLLSGSAIGVEGQLTLYCSSIEAPCYRCIFPHPPPPSCVGSCDSAGVLGPVPGVIGTMQAMEAIKMLGNVTNTSTLERKLLLFDAAECNFRKVTLRSRVKTCVVCGDNPTVSVATFNYQRFVNTSSACTTKDLIPNIPDNLRITVQQLHDLRKSDTPYNLIDVRPSTEFNICHLPEAQSHPLPTLRPSELPLKEAEEPCLTVFICRRGNKSRKAIQAALDVGVTNVCDIVGGLQAWHRQIDSNFPLY